MCLTCGRFYCPPSCPEYYPKSRRASAPFSDGVNASDLDGGAATSEPNGATNTREESNAKRSNNNDSRTEKSP